MSSNYLFVNQRPQEGDARTPLADVDRADIGNADGVILSEQDCLGYLVLRGRSQNIAAIEAELGCTLPVAPLSSTTTDSMTVRWISPTEWLITIAAGQTADLEAKLRGSLGDEVAVVDNSGGYASIHLSGPMADMVMYKSTGYDIHPSNFPRGKVVTTTFAQAQTILRRLDDESYELIFRRSFADYIWRWLRDASQEYGLRVEG